MNWRLNSSFLHCKGVMYHLHIVYNVYLLFFFLWPDSFIDSILCCTSEKMPRGVNDQDDEEEGRQGIPCLRSLLALIHLEGSPLMMGATLLDSSIFSIHLHQFAPKPLALRIEKRKFQSIQSNAFLKSTLKICPVF